MKSNWFPVALGAIIFVTILNKSIIAYRQNKAAEKAFGIFIASQPLDTIWQGGYKNEIPYNSDSGKLIGYGRELIANTSYYLGPRGTQAKISNGMNCQNCHLDAGTVPFGNNFGKAYTTYPQFRARSNKLETIYERINECLERSLNGKAMDTTTPEMKAMYAYIKWVGTNITKGEAMGGTGLTKLKYLDEAADPVAGKQVFLLKCISCHGDNGQGQSSAGETGFRYPPLWGPRSYNDGAGLYRISSFAGFVKNNMPFGTDYHNPMLTDREAWDVAAFVNSQPRPHRDQAADWANLSGKPIDFPYGPYIDTFTLKQHKYGPFKPIIHFQQSIK